VIVVIDTNVWVSGLQFAKHRGTPTLALEKAMSEDVIAICYEINAEIVRVLTEKFFWEPRRVNTAVDTVMARAVHVTIRGIAMRRRLPLQWPSPRARVGRWGRFPTGKSRFAS